MCLCSIKNKRSRPTNFNKSTKPCKCRLVFFVKCLILWPDTPSIKGRGSERKPWSDEYQKASTTIQILVQTWLKWPFTVKCHWFSLSRWHAWRGFTYHSGVFLVTGLFTVGWSVPHNPAHLSSTLHFCVNIT